jgi:hypothetical protein
MWYLKTKTLGQGTTINRYCIKCCFFFDLSYSPSIRLGFTCSMFKDIYFCPQTEGYAEPYKQDS